MIDGKPAMVPDDATEEEINSLFPAQRPAPPSTNGTTIGAPTSSENPLTQFFQQAGQDLSLGGTRTAVGRLLGQLQGRGTAGYSGLNSGVSERTADILGSPELGVAKALEGVAMTPQHPVAGPVKAIAGALQAATIPSMVLGVPEARAAYSATADTIPGMIATRRAIIPTRARAGAVLNRVAQAAGDTPVTLENSASALQRLAELGERGGSGKVPPGVMQLLNRSQAIEPLGYTEARDFASNISDLSSLEKMGINKQVGSQMNELRSGLHQDIADALPEGVGQDYLNAVREYARASGRSEVAGRVGKNVLQGAKYGVPAALGFGGLAEILKRYTR